uniref:C2H2-type domain-containing protein n=1 Tax=Caenorhabditis tropicalis TaxID=1561998 RepID=A0A1I7TBK5_9PELO
MDDATEQVILDRLGIYGYEENQFHLKVKNPDDVVVPALRQRSTCDRCLINCPTERARLWHQFVHVKAYNGFLSGKTYLEMPPFDYYCPCPNSTCHMKFEDFIDAKFHYMMDHKGLQLFCCGTRFPRYGDALKHIMENHGLKWPKEEHDVGNLQPVYVCNCHQRAWPSRPEYTAHLQGKIHKCPDPVCKVFFQENEPAITHFFEVHYKHLVLDTRYVLLHYKAFEMHQEKHAERCNIFAPVIPCDCNHQFVYCYHQRDLLLRLLPVFREALEHIEREAPYSEMPEDVCNIYRTMLIVLADVHDRLLHEKYANYQRTCSLKHSKFARTQVAKILIGVIEYFANIM